MDNETREYLNKFYSRLYDNLEIKGKIKNKSALLSFLFTTSNQGYDFLNKSSILLSKTPKNVLEYLVTNELIRQTDEMDYYVITAKGVWEIESETKQINAEILVTTFDDKFFNLFQSSKPLSEKEKVIIFALIAARSFSEESALDLKRGEKALQEMKDLMERSYDILKRHGTVLELKAEKLFGETGNENPVYNILRHSGESCKKKTKGIFKTTGKQQYYLDLYKDNVLSIKDMGFLLWLIYGDHMPIEKKDEIEDYCLDIMRRKSIYLYDLKTHKFAKPAYDDVIKKAIDEYYLSKNMWKR